MLFRSIEARDLEIGLDRVLLRALLGVEVADLEPDSDVLRILVDDPQVLLHRLVDLSLIDKLAGRIHDLFFVKGHGVLGGPRVTHHNAQAHGNMPRALKKGTAPEAKGSRNSTRVFLALRGAPAHM